MVENTHRHISNDVDSKISINPLFDCEPEIIGDGSTSVKTEIDRFDSCVPVDGTIYIPSTSYWNDTNRDNDDAKELKNNNLDIEQISHSNQSLKLDRESASSHCHSVLKRMRKTTKQLEHRRSKRSKIIKTKKQQSGSKWQLPSNVEKIMQVTA